MTDILVVSPISSHPPSSGARVRINALLLELKRMGHRVHFVYTACERVDREQMRKLMSADWDSVHILPSGAEFAKTQGEDYGLDDWTVEGHVAAIGELARRYDVTHCLINYVFQSRYFEALPNHVIRILDTHDKLSRRQLFVDMEAQAGFYHTTEEEELRGLARADVVLAIQDEEADYFARSGRPVMVVGHLAPFNPVERRFTDCRRIGYVGAVNKFNVHALERFLPAYAAWAARTEAPPRLSVAGNICRIFQNRAGYDFDMIAYDGFITDLEGYFGELDLYVNPTLVGTGLKIKSVEAMARGMPVVSTAVGWEGLQGMPGLHDAADTHELLGAIQEVHGKGFDLLTKLSNFSKATFAEYQANIHRNLSLILALDREGIRACADGHPHFVGSRQEENPDFIRLENIRPDPAGERPVIAHVVNPVRMPKSSDLYVAQPQAFRAMRFAQAATQTTDVVLFARRFEEDEGYLEECFDYNERLSRSARDLDITEKARKLPLLGDVFSTKGLPDEVTHVVYTNSDIGVRPHFYDFLAERFAAGEDAVIINRRTVSKRFVRADELYDILDDPGADHPGFDCFAVRRDILEKSEFADTLVGVHLIGRVVFWNILARSEKIGYHPTRHLTFHIGDDVPSKGRSGLPYIRHNLLQGREVARRLQRNPGYFTDPKRLTEFDRALSVNPGEIVGHRDPDRDPVNRIHMHSFFRAGSTYVYQKVRKQASWTAFYEPFHEDLALFSPDTLDEFRRRHDNSSFRHQSQSRWLFAEFEPLLDAGAKGVRGYDRRMSYMLDFVGSREAMSSYVEELTRSTSSENVFLQFNRTALRQGLMRELFPDDGHIYLQRGLREIWGSFLSFEKDGLHGFLRNNLATLLLNADHPLMQRLGEHVPLRRAPFRRFFHKTFSDVYPHYSIEDHFLIHAVFWHAARIQAERHADMTLDLRRISQDRLARLEAEAWLAAHRINISFRDVNLTSYDDGDLGLSSGRMDQIETLGRDLAEAADGELWELDTVPTEEPARSSAEADVERVLDQWRSGDIKRDRGKLAKLVGKRPWGATPFSPGAYSAADLAEYGALAAGFGRAGSDGVWASGPNAMIRLVLTPEAFNAEQAEVVLHMSTHPMMACRYQETRIYLDGTFLGVWLLGANIEQHSLSLDADRLRERGGRVEIGFAMPTHYAGAGEDDPPASICLTGIDILPAGSAAHQPDEQQNATKGKSACVHGP